MEIPLGCPAPDPPEIMMPALTDQNDDRTNERCGENDRPGANRKTDPHIKHVSQVPRIPGLQDLMHASPLLVRLDSTRPLTRLRAIIADFRSGSHGGLCWVWMAGSSPQRSISLKIRCGSLGSAGIWARLRCTFRTTHQSRALVRLGTAPSPMSTRPLQLQYAALHVFGSEHPLLDLRAFQLSFTCPLNQFGSQA